MLCVHHHACFRQDRPQVAEQKENNLSRGVDICEQPKKSAPVRTILTSSSFVKTLDSGEVDPIFNLFGSLTNANNIVNDLLVLICHYRPFSTNFAIKNERATSGQWSVVVAQLAERSLPTLEDLGLNPVIGNFHM